MADRQDVDELDRRARASSCRLLARPAWRTHRTNGSSCRPFPSWASEGEVSAAGGTILVMRDVTAARNARAVRDAFLGILSHELRTPVTTIYGGARCSRAVGRPSAEEQRREVYDDIRAEADRLYRLVENLLVLSRVERQGLHRHGAGAAAAPDAARDRVRSRRAGRARHGCTKLPSGLPPVAGEETYVEQVLRNLLGNAAKYGGDGPVTICAADSGDRSRDRASDAGPGFPDGEAGRLFDLFYRSPHGRSASQWRGHRPVREPPAGQGDGRPHLGAQPRGGWRRVRVRAPGVRRVAAGCRPIRTA